MEEDLCIKCSTSYKGYEFEKVHQFQYLGVTVMSNIEEDNEIEKGI